ncbi:MAG: glycosyltransferase family 39 protein, partial [Thermoanaerobaculia bacterium]
VVLGWAVRIPRRERLGVAARPVGAESAPLLSAREAALLGVTAVVAIAFRFYRLDDLLRGMHGDEAEVGLDALRVLHGQRVPPFATGWFEQGNLYTWGVALGMRIGGVGVLGVRLFSAVAGLLLLVPTYLLAREWFGRRVGLVASAFLAISGVAANFSRMEFSNVTTPLTLATGFAFLFRGLRRGSLGDFLLAGYAHAAGLYFYQGGRLTPIIGVTFFVSLVTLVPLLEALRAGLRRSGHTVRAVIRRHGLRVRRLAIPSLVYLVALLVFASPFLAYAYDHRQVTGSRAQEKLIFNNEVEMAAVHHVDHSPLELGIRMPRAADALALPIAFEKTRFSVTLAHDGFWPRVLWRQLVVTLSILTLRGDASSVYTFTGEPVAKPFEAVLILLTLCFALARLSDPRYAALSIWFWGTIVAGGVFTINAPYMARLVGVIPLFAICSAVSLDALVSAIEAALGRSAPLWRRRLAAVVIGVVLLLLARENFADYFGRYTRTPPLPFAPTAGQAWFVRETNRAAKERGEPPPRYFDLGAHATYWNHSVNRLVNPDAAGEDLVNPSQRLPLTEPPESDAVFMVWDHNRPILAMIEAFYPHGILAPFHYGREGQDAYLFTQYRVPREELLERHSTFATYTPSKGPALSRVESTFGSASPPPAGLVYPVRARWKGSLFSPAFARYRFGVESPAHGLLRIDGRAVVDASNHEASAASAEVVLARGLHQVELEGAFAGPKSQVRVLWSGEGLSPRPIERRFVFRGAWGSLLGTVRALPAGEPVQPFLNTPLFDLLPLVSSRLDTFLGFRDAGNALGGKPLVAVWRGTLKDLPAGVTRFELHANGGALLLVDGERVVELREGGAREMSAGGDVTLAPGPHALDVWYSWQKDAGTLELFLTPEGKDRRLLGPDDLEPSPGIFGSNEAPPGNAAPEIGDTPRVRVPRVIDLGGLVKSPRGLAVAANGELFVADTGGHRVVRLDRDGKLIGAFGRKGSGDGEFDQLEDIGLDREGRVVTLDSGSRRVQVFTSRGAFVRSLGQDAGFCSPAGFAVAPDGGVVVADTCNGRLVKLDAAGRLEKEILLRLPERMEQPVDVAIGPDGLLYVADLTPRVIALDPKTFAIRRTFATPVGTLQGASNLAVCGERLFLSDPNRDLVATVDTALGGFGALRGESSAPFSLPLAITCTPRGGLYVVDREGARLQIFPPTLGADG